MQTVKDSFDQNYMPGWRNHFSSEKIPGALPMGQNSPQKPPLGLYSEQISGTAFTAPRAENLRSWLYRIRPSAIHGEYKPYSHSRHFAPDLTDARTPPTQFRWDPIHQVDSPTNFIQGLVTMVGNGSPNSRQGILIHHYGINSSMADHSGASKTGSPGQSTAAVFADSELLILPSAGAIEIRTEMGVLNIKPTEIAVIPRGIKFAVNLQGCKNAAGYVCENYGFPFQIPDLGPIGANGLANPRDFLTPVADFEDRDQPFDCITKFQNKLWQMEIRHSPFDVVAWHGNYAPYKYDLKKFNTMNTVSFDHPDPSIFTVLTSPSGRAGTANCDFVIFPARWMVAENTFRPPYYHRNIMSEYMGILEGQYDAKEEGFAIGGATLHNCMSAHGPDADAFEKATKQDLKPERYKDTLAFMLETMLPFQVTDFALNGPTRQKDYLDCWKGIKKHFKVGAGLAIGLKKAMQ